MNPDIPALRRIWWPLALLLCGCAGETAVPASRPVTAPEQLSVDGATWDRQAEVTPAQESQLTRYFQRNPSMSGNPLVGGQPTLYTAGAKTRYYWLSTLDDQVLWLFLEFENSQFVTAGECSGEPFSPVE